MDIGNIPNIGLQSGMPNAYSMVLMRKAMGTETSMAVRELNMLPRLPQAPAVPKGKFLDVYA